MDDNVTVDDIELAKLVLSDCGCSTEHAALLDRVAARIGKHADHIRAQLAEITKERDEEEAIRERCANLLAETAVALKGPEKALHRHGWQDLPEVAVNLTARLSESEQRELEAAAQVALLRDFVVGVAEGAFRPEIRNAAYIRLSDVGTPPQAMAALRAMHLEEAAKACEAYDERIEGMRDSEYQAELAGRQAGAMRCAAAIRRLAQGEGKEGEA